MEIITVKRLRPLFEPYEDLWDIWKISKDCFLTRKQIIVFENYLNTGSLEGSCRKFRIDIKKAEHILNVTIILLHFKQPDFEKWIVSTVSKCSEFWFINAPIKKLPIPLRFRKLLTDLKEPNLKSVLNKYSQFDLYKKWSVDRTIEFKKILKGYNCDNLLRI
ncbi:MAG TPA: hypothetical protein VN026_08155 [Bacteroidia bacterium]|jgi:hypothetical protein|nr:hypothetical protein [Bacteroidia bacterium]